MYHEFNEDETFRYPHLGVWYDRNLKGKHYYYDPFGHVYFKKNNRVVKSHRYEDSELPEEAKITLKKFCNGSTLPWLSSFDLTIGATFVIFRPKGEHDDDKEETQRLAREVAKMFAEKYPEFEVILGIDSDYLEDCKTEEEFKESLETTIYIFAPWNSTRERFFEAMEEAEKYDCL